MVVFIRHTNNLMTVISAIAIASECHAGINADPLNNKVKMNVEVVAVVAETMTLHKHTNNNQ